MRIQYAVLPLLSVLLLSVLAAASFVGAVPVPLFSFFREGLDENHLAVLYSIRFPRVLLAAAVGAALAVSGAAMQGLFRNPLADPGLIGVSGGAALGVAVMTVASGSLEGVFGVYGLGAAAFAGGTAACLLVLRFSRIAGTFSVTRMLLSGIAVNALAGAGTGFLTYLSDDEQLRSLTFWIMGSLGGALWVSVIVVLSVVIPAVAVMMANAQKLNILMLGEDEARHLGVNSESLKLVIIVCAALSVGVAVAVSGIIGFVGLVVPHLIRLAFGPDHRLLIPASALLGAVLLVSADTAARTVVSPAEMPVGILTSLIGGPFFLWLLAKQYSGRFRI